MLKKRIKAFAAGEEAATAIEYAIIAAGIFLAIVPQVTSISASMGVTYGKILQYFFDING